MGKQLTPKQAAIKATQLLKGIDNSATKINKERDNIAESVSALNDLVTGLSNSAAEPAAAKNNGAAKATKAAKSEKKAAKKTQPSSEKRSFKDLAIEFLRKNGATPATKLHELICKEFGTYSKQIMYKTFKDNPTVFKKVGNPGNQNIDLIDPEKDKVDRFVDSVAKDAAVENTV